MQQESKLIFIVQNYEFINLLLFQNRDVNKL